MLNNVPLVGQSLAQTRDLIATNFSTIDTAFSVNHVPYDVSGPSSQGLHQFVQMPTGTPIIATAAAQTALYSKNGGNSGIPELFFQRENLPADFGYAITEKGLGPNPSTDAWTRFPSGVLMKWGSATMGSGSTNGTLSYNLFGPNYSAQPYVCFITTVYNVSGPATNFDQTVFFSGFTGTNFGTHKQGTGSVVTFQYLLIGLG